MGGSVITLMPSFQWHVRVVEIVPAKSLPPSTGEGSYAELLEGGLEISVFLKAHDTDTDKPATASCEATAEHEEASTATSNDRDPITADESGLVDDEAMEEGDVPLDIYMQYMKFGAGWCTVLILAVVVTSDEALRVCSHVWLAWWSQASDGNVLDALEDGSSAVSLTIPDDPDGQTFGGQYHAKGTDFFLATYSLICLGQWATNVAKGMIWVSIAVKASTQLHKNLLQRVLRAPISFFDRTPVGRILNRFSRDTNEIDSELMWLMDATCQLTVQVVGKIAAIIVISEYTAALCARCLLCRAWYRPGTGEYIVLVAVADTVMWVLFMAPVVFASYFALFKLYSKTNVGLKRLE